MYIYGMRQRERAYNLLLQKKKIKLDFPAFFLLLTMNFVIALSKKSADPSYRLVDPQLL